MFFLMRPTLFPMLFRHENVKLLRYLGGTKNPEFFSKVIHTRFIVSDQCSRDNIPSINALIDIYSKCEAQGSARHYGFACEVVRLFKSMVSDHDESFLPPNEYTSGLALSNVGYLSLAILCHGYLLKSGLVFNYYVKTALVRLYSMLSNVVGAMEVLLFNPIGLQLDACSYNQTLVGLVDKGYLDEALIISRRMLAEEDMVWKWKWNKATYIAIFGLCARLLDLDLGRQVENKLLKSCDVEFDESLCSAMINMYGKYGEILSARKVFDMFEPRNTDIYTAMFDAYSEHGFFKESMKLFSKTRREDVFPNESTFCVLLNVSAELFSMKCGGMLHSLAEKTGLIKGYKNVEDSLIDMHSRTGYIKAAEEVFFVGYNSDLVTIFLSKD